MDNPCTSCGYDIYELVDGHYYCLECHEELLNVVEKEVETFDNENIVFDTKGIKQKDSKKEEKKRQTALNSRITSCEEYNYILRGLVDEILMIEHIPDFKKTVLQLWINYLKYLEVAFYDDGDLAHLPKFFAKYRQKDAEILYNHKPIKRKRNRKKKAEVVVKIEGDTREARKVKRRSSRKSLKKIQKMNEDSESFVSSNTSTLTNLTIEDIEATMLGEELNIEFSECAKRVLERKKNYMKTRKIKLIEKEFGQNSQSSYKFFNSEDSMLILSGITLMNIIFFALNICGSSIQMCDLLRFAREGHISYYSFKRLLPEKFDDAPLSLEKYHSLCYLSHRTMGHYLKSTLINFPEIRPSLKIPNLTILARRYIQDLNLPSYLFIYVEKLMELLPSTFKKSDFGVSLFDYYESRAMAYILFVVKLLFGIDGYREKEISQSAKTINSEFEKLKIPRKVFDYEAWREYIEYRETLLDKYYFPTIHNDVQKTDRPYEKYLTMMKTVEPECFRVLRKEEKLNKTQKSKLNQRAELKELTARLMNLHDENPMNNIKFKWSFTPLKDALRVILDSPLGSSINKTLLDDFTDDSLEFYIDPDKLVEIFSQHDVKLLTKPSTFPKNFSFEANVIPQLYRGTCNRDIMISHDTISKKEWIKNHLKSNKNKLEAEKEKKIHYHQKTFEKVIRQRLNVQKKINVNDIQFDEIVSVEEDPSIDANELTFIHSDFNFWHRRIPIYPSKINMFKEDIKRLPKSMLWLLNAASKVICQEPIIIFFNLMILENQFVNVYEPLELTDNELILKIDKKKPKGVERFNRYM